MLAALVAQAGGEAIETGIARDDADIPSDTYHPRTASDILVLSGGVSAGVLDLVPQILAERGVEQVFHKVNLKPGKPLWFGMRTMARSKRSSLACPATPLVASSASNSLCVAR